LKFSFDFDVDIVCCGPIAFADELCIEAFVSGDDTDVSFTVVPLADVDESLVVIKRFNTCTNDIDEISASLTFDKI
jgi:hypothetical protein